MCTNTMELHHTLTPRFAEAHLGGGRGGMDPGSLESHTTGPFECKNVKNQSNESVQNSLWKIFLSVRKRWHTTMEPTQGRIEIW